MRLVVVDRSLILPAVCSTKSKYRALLVIFQYGRHSAYARSGTEEQELPDELEGATFGGPSIGEVVRKAEDAKAVLEDRLPGMPPEDWGMLISRPLLDSYTAAIRDDHPKWGLELVPEEVAAARQKLLSTAVGLVPDDAVLPIYPYTKDRGDNIALHTAIVGGAEFLVTQKSDLYEDPSFGRRWEHESGRSVLAVTFDRIADMITTLSSANGERRTQTAASRGSVPPTRPTRERAP